MDKKKMVFVFDQFLVFDTVVQSQMDLAQAHLTVFSFDKNIYFTHHILCCYAYYEVQLERVDVITYAIC